MPLLRFRSWVLLTLFPGRKTIFMGIFMATTTETRGFYRVVRLFTKGPTTDSSSDYSGKLQWTDSFQGQKNPLWKFQVANHENAGTPMSGDRFIVEGRTSGLWEVSLTRISPLSPYDKQTNRLSGDLLDDNDLLVSNPYSNPVLLLKAHNRALSGFYAKNWKALRHFQGGTFLGELREALHMIKRPGKSFRKLIDFYHTDALRRSKAIRRGRRLNDPSYVSDANKAVSDTWLEWSFGMRPLMSDVKAGAEALARLALEPREYIKTRFTAEEREEEAIAPSLRSYTKTLQLLRFRIRNRGIMSISVRYIGEVRCEVASPALMRAEVLGFKPEDFLPTIWELIPYSFLVDYFSNIGEVISAWSFPQGSLAWHNRTERAEAFRNVTATPLATVNPNPSLWTVSHTTGPDLEVRTSRTTVIRTQTPLGFPSITFEIPGSSLKWLNIAALAHMRRAPGQSFL